MGRRALTAAGALLLAAVSVASAPGAGAPEVFRAMRAMPADPPAAAPAAEFRDLDGRVVSLEAFRGRAVLLTFFTTW